MPKIAVIVGTRPEAIKLAPVIQSLRNDAELQSFVCDTGQHMQLCRQTLACFSIEADCSLDVMRPNQPLGALQGRLLETLDKQLEYWQPDAVIVQGDTMSAFCGALAAFYRKIPVFHVEAGLRSHSLDEPFPEEALRQMLARVATLHFAPTQRAKKALLAENIPAHNIHITGNTVIDALFSLSANVLENAGAELETSIRMGQPLVLVTVHRRENHGMRLGMILEAILTLSKKFPFHQFILPVHPNPNVREEVYKVLSCKANIALLEPLSYPQLVCILQKSALVLSDSGGIQEEAPAFDIPLLVLREETERQEGVEAGCAMLVGADTQRIISTASEILQNGQHMPTITNPYGDGHAASRIVEHIKAFFNRNS